MKEDGSSLQRPLPPRPRLLRDEDIMEFVNFGKYLLILVLFRTMAKLGFYPI